MAFSLCFLKVSRDAWHCLALHGQAELSHAPLRTSDICPAGHLYLISSSWAREAKREAAARRWCQCHEVCLFVPCKEHNSSHVKETSGFILIPSIYLSTWCGRSVMSQKQCKGLVQVISVSSSWLISITDFYPVPSTRHEIALNTKISQQRSNLKLS